MKVEVAVKLGAALGESPVWDVDRQVLHLLDILNQKIHQFDPRGGALKTTAIDGVPGALALRADGGYIAGVGLDFANVELDGSVQLVARVRTGDRFNDGKCDPHGRFLAGTMDNQQRAGHAALYQLQLDGTVTQLLSDVALSNGMDWNLAGDQLYYIDTPLERIDLFDYDLATGQVSGRRPFADLKQTPGRPDGLTVDAEGGVWVAVARGGVVHRYSPDGQLDAVVEFPTRIVTSCAFGGQDLDQLYVTSSRALLSEDQQKHDTLAGDLFVVEGLGVRGRAPFRAGC